MTEKLTDEERSKLQKWADALPSGTVASALRIIDAHEADRAALVKERDEAHEQVLAYKEDVLKLRNLNSGLLKSQDCAKDCMRVLEVEVARLTEALAAAERVRLETLDMRDRQRERADAAEQKLAAAEHQATRALASSDEEYTLRKAAEARCRELELERDGLWQGKGERESELAQLRERVAEAEATLELVRIQVAPHRVAFEPATDDQATNAGRFKVALYLLGEVHAIVFPEALRGPK